MANVYINVLQQICVDQSCRVHGEKLSKAFPIERGVRQGDSIFPALFNAALEKLTRHLEAKWQNKRWGIQTYLVRRLVDLRFADDLLLMAGSKHQAVKKGAT